MDQQRLAQKYIGDVAASYEKKRAYTKKWEAEQAIVSGFLERFPEKTEILDIPVGTGRFVEVYQKLGFHCAGMDISADMLKEAKNKAEALGYHAARFLVTDIFDINAEDKEFDVTVCMRFLNWVDIAVLRRVFVELSRVTGGEIIFGIRYWTPLLDMRPWRSFGGLFKLLWQCIERVRAKGGLIWHGKDEVMEIFDNLGILIQEVVCVEMRRDGTEYYIYRAAIR